MNQLNYTVIILIFGLIFADQILGEDSEEAVDSVESLTEESCSKKRSGCCSEFFMGDSPNIAKCMTIHSSKMPDEDSEDLGKLFKFMSCFVECVYKRSKFIGKGDALNMKMVQLEAEQLYEERPKEKDYFLKSYESCRKKTQLEFNLLKSTPGIKSLLKNACRPYFMLLHMCVMDYHQKHECPYFRWESNSLDGKDQSFCERARAKCYAIDGLKVPANQLLE
ncbi:uncharacterized protein LOC117785908 [Drosophila innubila]|uniref:uncharacterized protein LOC117785908 n=1 Tax=Drosophila innubila TaxID=198719 RepID=UPI00148E7CCD|nr:uncharacterized protein LOC117785908 [Drosophila innubila]